MKAAETQRLEASPDQYEGEHFVFIVGSPRSGTTITAETLSRHPDIAYLYEPYYLWKQGTDNSEDDELKASDCDDASVSLIRRYCHHFWRRSGVSFIVEQSPEESLMVPLLQRILPRARFIHMIRDGYDCIRSIGVEWQRRAELVQSRNPLAIANKVLRPRTSPSTRDRQCTPFREADSSHPSRDPSRRGRRNRFRRAESSRAAQGQLGRLSRRRNP